MLRSSVADEGLFVLEQERDVLGEESLQDQVSHA